MSGGALPPSDYQQTAPHVMVSRINARLSSIGYGADSKDTIFDTGSHFARDESSTDDSWSVSTNESSGHGDTCVQTSASSSISSSLSCNGRWCEEERAIPLKKRRVVMISCEQTKQSKDNMKKGKKKKKDAVEIRKQEMVEIEDYNRCNRGNGKGWRCHKMRVEGLSLCKLHLEKQRMKQMNSPNGRNPIKKNKEVKARSISSLLKDTVSLLC